MIVLPYHYFIRYPVRAALAFRRTEVFRTTSLFIIYYLIRATDTAVGLSDIVFMALLCASRYLGAALF